ncbi:PREDICTED: uncharacterized protein LOC109344573 isoform X2 [Lupinus angustifolius]|uniref:uncharacterized protein LOC109344573 isoform X2 n=1 Tax=Lupinus angustifolius TaxID=3871 RepID=UPI00092F7C2C|nr:PREDICTED: uncharacterized protein LOC109344573 isoform X2 [Lupinus angustifolius]
MDLWVVAAAVGAGYLTKYWKRISKISGSSSHLYSEDSNIENPDSPRHPFRRRDKFTKDVVSSDRRAADVNSCFRICNESDVLCVSKLPVSFSANENFNDIEDGTQQSSNVSANCAFQLPESVAGEIGSIHNPPGNKNSLRSKHLYGNISRPLNSLESCLMAQLCTEHAKMEEYVFSPYPSSSSSVATRSFLVTDGNRIISRENDDASFSALAASEEYRAPSLPKIGSFDDFRREYNQSHGQSRRLISSNDMSEHLLAQRDATFIFSLGFSFGIITCIMANKREMDKLRELLKHNENLVQDLQEELEMKDSMTVKELHGENYGSQDTCDHSFCDKELNGFSPEKHTDNSPVIDGKKSYNQKEEESSESMSKIEAELEAELERLGLNMNESSLDRKLSELVEFDLDFVADFTEGELRTDKIIGEDIVQSKSNEDANETTDLPVNYAVSPRELSLRLHEVIQSRLEKRVEELEFALQNSQRKLRSMELKHENCSQMHFPSGGQASSFTKGNISTSDNCDPMTEPLVINLSGEALGAYNEAYEELMKTDDSDENSPSGIHDPDQKLGSQSNSWLQHGVDYSRIHPMANGDRLSRELSSIEAPMSEGQSSNVNELNDGSGDENCDYDYDYELERQLIMQIVERTKKDSPVLQSARKILYSMYEDEH